MATITFGPLTFENVPVSSRDGEDGAVVVHTRVPVTPGSQVASAILAQVSTVAELYIDDGERETLMDDVTMTAAAWSGPGHLTLEWTI